MSAPSIAGYRSRKVFRKTITFTGAAGAGAIGTVAVATIAGCICIEFLNARCTVDLVGAGTIEMGISGDTASLIAQIADATNLDAGEQWTDATPSKVATPVTAKLVDDNIVITIGAADITAGVIEVEFYYVPMSQDGFAS